MIKSGACHKSSFAPIALFVYNRPEHTRQTLESLSKCDSASGSELFIYCDGPKLLEDERPIREVRNIVASQKWCASVHINTRESNIGLASSIINGVTEIVNQYDRVIVLEDDLVLSPQFLNFMNTALETYGNVAKVMHISGYMFPVKGDLPETFFYRATSCWGWATWSRAWKNFEPDAPKLLAGIRDKKHQLEFDIEGSMNYYKMLQAQATSTIDSWAIRWYASVFLNNGLCLHPGKSLVDNIGHDGTGVHCGPTDVYSVEISYDQVLHYTQDIKESKKAIKLMVDFYKKPDLTLTFRLFDKLKKVIKKI